MATGNTKFTTQHGLQVVGNTEIEQDLKVLGSANVVGDLTVGGSMVFSANVIGNFIPDVSGRSLGNTTSRWELYANTINVSNTSTFSGSAVPSSNGINLGGSSARWFAYTTDISTSNSATVSNNVTVGNTLSVTTLINVGNAAAIQSNSVSYSNAVVGQTVVDSFSATTYRTAKYVIEVKNATTGYMAEELLLTHDGTTVFITEYSVVNTIATFCTFDADISSGSVRLLATPTTNATFKVARTMIV